MEPCFPGDDAYPLERVNEILSALLIYVAFPFLIKLSLYHPKMFSFLFF